MSGEKEPATSTAGVSRPRPDPSPRTAGRTAAAWLRVNGNWAPYDGTWPTGENRAPPGAHAKQVVVGSPGSRCRDARSKASPYDWKSLTGATTATDQPSQQGEQTDGDRALGRPWEGFTLWRRISAVG